MDINLKKVQRTDTKMILSKQPVLTRDIVMIIVALINLHCNKILTCITPHGNQCVKFTSNLVVF